MSEPTTVPVLVQSASRNPVEQLNSLNAVTALLDDVAEAEIRMARSEEVRREKTSLFYL